MRISTNNQLKWLIYEMSLCGASHLKPGLENIVIDFQQVESSLDKANNPKSPSRSSFAQALEEYNAQYISLSRQPWNDATLPQYLGSLARNLVVTHVNIAYNQFGMESVKALLALLNTDHIQSVDISGSCFEPEAFAYLNRKLEKTKHATLVPRLKGLDRCETRAASQTGPNGYRLPTWELIPPRTQVVKSYGVSDVLTSGELTPEKAADTFAKSTCFKRYTDLTEAKTYRNTIGTQNYHWFWRTQNPVIYDIVVKNSTLIDTPDIQKSDIEIAIVTTDNDDVQYLLYSVEDQMLMRSLVYSALEEYRSTIGNTTSTTSSADNPMVCSYQGLSDVVAIGTGRHSPAGVKRAEEFFASLYELDYYSLMERISKYVQGLNSGGLYRDNSFKAFLYVELLKHFGTAGQKAQNKATQESPEIRLEDLLDVLDTATQETQARVVRTISQARTMTK